ncbi:ABC transporter substrate-binding protein [Demequina sp. TTPB684]|uniref:ABC transporter substrate-binding protein n=1 Tax=unclassified Demequina TaxID=2620311 RepID=UPI001CF2B516|nr:MULTISPECIES: ABC transporter substrate-binding protein [unclassified Demequina]MCB2411901.1 ABC transporter substrate-binding protein [Demequina sp. TTPB684]UPU89361.1 ABC transporter substrate-binding protein [Demequina sp. TMPB413]
MARWNTIARGAAFAAVASLALAACSSSGDDDSTGPTASGDGGGTSSDGLKIGSLLPLTGSLAFLGPPEVAGVELAAKEINDAGGIFDSNVEIIHQDSSDTDNPQIAAQSVSALIADEVAAIVGAASSSVSLNVVDDIANAGIVQISPANTSTALSGYSPFYFRTAPPDTVQGSALGNLIVNDGIQKLGVLVFADDYGTSLRDVVQGVVEENGGEITYGKAGDEFQTDASNFESIVQDVIATQPDGILVIAFDQTKNIIPALVGAGYPADKLYFTDGNTADYSADFEAGVMTGAKGTIPGANPSDDFKALLDDVNGGKLDSYAYGAESYDATMLVALAALKGEGTDGQTVADNLAAVSGANGGTECTGWVECSELILAGEDIIYQAVAGVGPFNEDNDPASAYVGVYVFDDANVPQWTEAVYGEV